MTNINSNNHNNNDPNSAATTITNIPSGSNSMNVGGIDITTFIPSVLTTAIFPELSSAEEGTVESASLEDQGSIMEVALDPLLEKESEIPAYSDQLFLAELQLVLRRAVFFIFN